MQAQSKSSTRNKQQAKKSIFWLVLAIFLSAILVPVAISAPGDLIIPRKGEDTDSKYTPESIFPHWIHRVRYRCDACHDSLFGLDGGIVGKSPSPRPLDTLEIDAEKLAAGEIWVTFVNFKTGVKGKEALS